MKTDTPRPILLKDYRPPNYLIDTVNLDVALDPTRTRVRARLKMRPNPDYPGKPGPLRLDGELLELESVRLDGRQLGAARVPAHRPASWSSPSCPADPFTLEIVTYCNPEANKALTGLYLSRGIYCTQCEAQGFRRITYFLDRPDVLATYTVRIEADRERGPGAALQRRSRWSAARSTAASGTTRCGAIRTPSPATCSRWSAATSPPTPPTSRPPRAARSTSRIYVEPGKEGRCAWAMDSLKRSMRWDEERFGREYDLDVFNIVAVSDFNMGAMENKGLNIFNDAPGAGLARDRHRQQLRRHRARHRARVLPQLDRQPHHLPRLVPALPQGRPDRLPRPGVLRRPALAPPCSASTTCAT